MTFFSDMKQTLKDNWIFYLIGAAFCLGLKLYYRSADSCGLMWILTPTARWAGILGGYAFENLPHTGYVNHDLQFIIAKSCSGVQFMVITLAALIFSYTHLITRRLGAKKGFLWLALSLLLSYASTVLVNGLRIVLSIDLPPVLEKQGILRDLLTPKQLHTAIGCAVYFSSLLVIYRFAGRLSLRITGGCRLSGGFCDRLTESSSIADCESGKKGSLRQMIPPAFWYLFVVLGIPLLHHGKNGYEQFAEYAALITVICAAVLGVNLLFSDQNGRRLSLTAAGRFLQKTAWSVVHRNKRYRAK